MRLYFPQDSLPEMQAQEGKERMREANRRDYLHVDSSQIFGAGAMARAERGEGSLGGEALQGNG